MAFGTVAFNEPLNAVMVGTAAEHRGARFIVAPFALGSSVSAGGEVPDLTGLHDANGNDIIDTVQCIIPLGPARQTGDTDSILVAWRPATGKLQYYLLASNGGDEATGDLDAYTVDLLIIGYKHA